MNELTPDDHRILIDAIHDSATVIHKGQRMNEKLTYEEWRKRYTVSLGDDIKSQLQELHGIDADAEIEAAMRLEYKFYLDGID